MSPGTRTDGVASGRGVSWPRDAAIRAGESAVVWLGFGVVVGVCTAPTPTPIGVVSGVIAGVIVLTPFGAVMGVIGARWRETLVGGVAGGAVAATTTFAQNGEVGQVAAVGLIFGGSFGATFLTAFSRLPRLLYRAARGPQNVTSIRP